MKNRKILTVIILLILVLFFQIYLSVQVSFYKQAHPQPNGISIIEEIRTLKTSIDQIKTNQDNLRAELNTLKLSSPQNGVDGRNGRDGLNGKAGANGYNGKSGHIGLKGEKGDDGNPGIPVELRCNSSLLRNEWHYVGDTFWYPLDKVLACAGGINGN